MVERKAAEVQSNVEEVRDLKKEIEILVNRVQTSEKNVRQMQSFVQQISRSMLEPIIFIVDSTQHQMPQKAFDEFLKRINSMADLAYPNQHQKKREMTRTFGLLNQPLPSPLQKLRLHLNCAKYILPRREGW